MKVKPRCEPKKVKISGPAFTDKGVPASIPTDLIIDPTQAGFGDLEVQVMVSFIGLMVKTLLPSATYMRRLVQSHRLLKELQPYTWNVRSSCDSHHRPRV